MSFDLGVWRSEAALSVEDAGEVYARLCEGTWAPDGEDESVHAFYAELCAAYPEIDEVPEGKLDECPWSCEHSRSGIHVIVTMHGGASATCRPGCARPGRFASGRSQ